MKFSANREALLRALGHAAGIADRRASATVPVLAGIMMSLSGDRIVMSSTDLEIGLVETFSVSGERNGVAVVPASTLHEVVKRQPAGAEISFTLSDDGENVSVRSGRFATKLATLPVDDFPKLSAANMSHRLVVEADKFVSLFARTRFAVSTEETRYYLNGVYLHTDESDGVAVLRAVATDGHRLARVDIPAPEGAVGMPGIIIPRKTINEMFKLLSDAEGDVEVSVGESRIRIVFGDLAITSKLIDGTYPDYKKVIPAPSDNHVEVSVEAFADAIGRVAAISSDRAAGVKIEGSPSCLRLSTTSPERGSATEEIDGDNIIYEGPSFQVGFQARYLTEIAQVIGDRLCMMVSGDGSTPVLFRPARGDASLFVLMPLRV